MLNIETQIIVAVTRLTAAYREGNETEQQVWNSILDTLIKFKNIKRSIDDK